MRLCLACIVVFLAGCGPPEKASSPPAPAKIIAGPSNKNISQKENNPFVAKVQYIKAGQSRFAYYQRGSGPTLLMLTGTGSTMSEWDPALLRLLAKNNNLIMIDYPGVGLSRGSVPRTFASMAEQISLFISAKQLTEINVLGWSMGGFVAQQLTQKHPGQVSRLILASTNPGGSHAVLGSSSDQAADNRPDSKEMMAQLYSNQQDGKAFLSRLEKSSQSGEIPNDFKVSSRALAKQIKAEDPWLRSNQNWNDLPILGAPVLAAGGRGDRVTPIVNMFNIARRVKQGQVASFSGRHAFLFSDSVLFSKRVNSFLK